MTFTLYENKEITELTDQGRSKLQRLFYSCNTMLGGTSIPVQLEEDDYTVAFEAAVAMYRSRSSRSVDQTVGTVKLKPGQRNYTLHERVDVVKMVRRGGGGFLGSLSSVSGSDTAVLESQALMNLAGAGAGGGTIDVPSVMLTMQYIENLNKVFSRDLMFDYRVPSRELVILDTVSLEEDVLLEVSVLKTLDELLEDHWAYEWLRKYTLAEGKGILGEKLTLFSVIAGPQGGTTTKGERLVGDSKTEKEQLEIELYDFGDNSDVAIPTIG